MNRKKNRVTSVIKISKIRQVGDNKILLLPIKVY